MNDMTNSNLGSEIGLDDEILAAEDSWNPGTTRSPC